jgi:hypothetical protein
MGRVSGNSFGLPAASWQERDFEFSKVRAAAALNFNGYDCGSARLYFTVTTGLRRLQRLLQQLMQCREFRLANIALDDVALLVDDVGCWCQFDVAK